MPLADVVSEWLHVYRYGMFSGHIGNRWVGSLNLSEN